MGWGSLGNIVGSVVGGYADYQMNRSSAKRVQERAEKYTERQMQNAHQWEVADLEAAGLNPVLSANSAHAVGGASGSEAPSNSMSNLEKMASAKQLESQTKLTKSTEKVNDSTVKLNQANAVKAEEKAGVIAPTAKANIRKINSEIGKMDAEIALMDKQGQLIEAEKNLKKTVKAEIDQRLPHVKEQIRAEIAESYSRQALNKWKADTEASQFQLNMASAKKIKMGKLSEKIGTDLYDDVTNWLRKNYHKYFD